MRIVCECDLADAMVQQDQYDLGLGAVVRSGVASGAISSCCFSLFSIFLAWKSFEGKIKPEMVLHQRGLFYGQHRKSISVDPIFSM